MKAIEVNLSDIIIQHPEVDSFPQLLEKVRDTLESDQFGGHEEHIDRLLEAGHSATDISGALFALLYGSISREGEEIAEDRPQNKGPRRERDRDRGDRPNRDQRDDRRSDRGSDRGPRPQHQSAEGMATLFVSIGKAEGLRPGDLAGMIYSEADLPKGSVGRIALFAKHSLVDVRSDLADTVIDRCGNASLRGRTFRIGHDRFK